MASDVSASLHDYLRIKFRIDTTCKIACCVPHTTWKDYRRQWVVLSSHVSPPMCFLSYCGHEDDWLTNQKLPKLTLEKFNLNRHQVNARASNKCHLEVVFEHYTLFIEFNSSTKLQEWFDSLEKIRCRVLTDLVRSPSHPEREKLYVAETLSDRIKFMKFDNKEHVEFEWKMSHIRRAHYYKLVGKVEIEVGRMSQTGEGKFFFIGPNINHFFLQLKEKIGNLSKANTMIERGNERMPKTLLENEQVDRLENLAALDRETIIRPRKKTVDSALGRNTSSISNESTDTTGEENTGDDESVPSQTSLTPPPAPPITNKTAFCLPSLGSTLPSLPPTRKSTPPLSLPVTSKGAPPPPPPIPVTSKGAPPPPPPIPVTSKGAPPPPPPIPVTSKGAPPPPPPVPVTSKGAPPPPPPIPVTSKGAPPPPPPIPVTNKSVPLPPPLLPSSPPPPSPITGKCTLPLSSSLSNTGIGKQLSAPSLVQFPPSLPSKKRPPPDPPTKDKLATRPPMPIPKESNYQNPRFRSNYTSLNKETFAIPSEYAEVSQRILTRRHNSTRDMIYEEMIPNTSPNTTKNTSSRSYATFTPRPPLLPPPDY